jgi:pilus assembly protein Flp/PilA
MLPSVLRACRQLLQSEDGPTAVEYAVMLALIVVVCIGAITTLGSNAASTFSFVASNVAPADSSGGGTGDAGSDTGS